MCFGVSAVCLIGAILNAAQIAVMIYKKKRRLPFDKTLLSLAFADFFSSLFWGLFWISSDSLLFSVYLVGSYLSIISSLLHAVFIAAQRFFAVFLPIKFRIYFKEKFCTICLIILWIISLPLCGLMGLYKRPTVMSYVIFPSGGLLVVLYSLICYRVHLQRRSVSAVSASSRQQNDSTYRILAYSILITTVFLLCTIPFAVSVLGSSPGKCYEFVLISMNPVVDAVMYFAFNHLRKHRCCHCCQRLTGKCQARMDVSLPATSSANTEQSQMQESKL